MRKTKIILTRKKAFLHWARSMRVLIDGQESGTIKNGETKEFEVTPGVHKITCKMSWYSTREYEATISEGNTEHLQVRLGMKGFVPIYLLLLAVVFYQFYLRYSKTPVPAYFETARLIVAILVFGYFIYYLTFGRKQYLVIDKDSSGFFAK